MKYQKILKNGQYNRYLDAINNLEKDRIYCKHDLSHLMDVARICMLIAKEQKIVADADIVCAAGLLHDIGRCNPNIANHEELSAEIAKSILPECGYTKDEIAQVVNLILSHRGRDSVERINERFLNEKLALTDCFKIADQLSRNCFNCAASATCKWKAEERVQAAFI